MRDSGQESVHSVGETLERTMMQTSVKMPATSICALVCTEKDVQLCVTFDQLVCLAKASAPNFQFGAQVPTGEDGKESLKGISHEVISFRFLDNCQVASVLVPEAEAAELPFQLHIQPSNSQTVKQSNTYTHIDIIDMSTRHIHGTGFCVPMRVSIPMGVQQDTKKLK